MGWAVSVQVVEDNEAMHRALQEAAEERAALHEQLRQERSLRHAHGRPPPEPPATAPPQQPSRQTAAQTHAAAARARQGLPQGEALEAAAVAVVSLGSSRAGLARDGGAGCPPYTRIGGAQVLFVDSADPQSARSSCVSCTSREGPLAGRVGEGYGGACGPGEQQALAGSGRGGVERTAAGLGGGAAHALAPW
jgi:hypothetical protein